LGIAWAPLILAVSLLAVAGNTMLKAGADRGSRRGLGGWSGLVRTMLQPLVLAGLGAYMLSQVLWITELRVIDLSLAFPLQIGLNFILITIIARALFREPLSGGKLAGIFLIFAGILVMAAA